MVRFPQAVLQNQSYEVKLKLLFLFTLEEQAKPITKSVEQASIFVLSLHFK